MEAEQVTIKIMECLTVSYLVKQEQIDEINRLVQDFAKQERDRYMNDGYEIGYDDGKNNRPKYKQDES